MSKEQNLKKTCLQGTIFPCECGNIICQIFCFFIKESGESNFTWNFLIKYKPNKTCLRVIFGMQLPVAPYSRHLSLSLFVYASSTTRNALSQKNIASSLKQVQMALFFICSHSYFQILIDFIFSPFIVTKILSNASFDVCHCICLLGCQSFYYENLKDRGHVNHLSYFRPDQILSI